MKSGIFVSGTDTGIGKTVVSSLLISALKRAGFNAGYFKPVQTGDDLDSVTVSQLTGISHPQLASPCYSFPQPVAPYRAARMQNTEIQLDTIRESWKSLENRFWIVEGAGGLLVPLNSRQTIRDLIQTLGLELLLVTSTRLGTINHTLLTLEAARSAGIKVKGLVLVGDEDFGLDDVLGDFTQVPVLAKIPKYESISQKLINEVASLHFTPSLLRTLYE